jgi:hypothetical protein
MQTISAQAHSKSSPHEVWALLADTSSWARWAPFDDAGLQEQGSPESEGVGAIRRFRAGRRITRERVVVFEPPTRLGYEPVVRHPDQELPGRGDAPFGDDGGTLIQWESRFEGQFPIPGSLIKRKLESFVRETAEALARAAEKQPSEGGSPAR